HLLISSTQLSSTISTSIGLLLLLKRSSSCLLSETTMYARSCHVPIAGERSAQLKMSQGLCTNLTCGNYLDINSTTFCTEHLRRRAQTDKSSYRGSHNGQPLSRSYQDSVGSSSTAGSTISTRTFSTASDSSSQASSRRSTRSYASSPTYSARPYYSASRTFSSVSAAGARFNNAWSSSSSRQSREPPSSGQRYSDYASSSDLSADQSYSSSEFYSQDLDDDDVFLSAHEDEFEVPHISPNHYWRPLPEASPYQAWVWPDFHENWPFQDRQLYCQSYYPGSDPGEDIEEQECFY
ncbi:hypothetical protein F5B19DRAFT_498981, partial [Rostrohypoxylon terebratum]